jgi:hypothetical protein
VRCPSLPAPVLTLQRRLQRRHAGPRHLRVLLAGAADAHAADHLPVHHDRHPAVQLQFALVSR